MRYKHLQTSLIFIFISILTSCATVGPAQIQSLNATERQQILSRIQTWQLNGKIGVQTDNDSGSAFVTWVQNKNQYQISLLSPLGTGGFKLVGQPHQVVLTTADGKHFTAATPEQLLAEQWGYDLPISYLHDWIRGLPAAGVAYQGESDQNHRFTQLTQQNWHVQFQHYVQIDGTELPNKISITSPSLRIKIVIYHWKLG